MKIKFSDPIYMKNPLVSIVIPVYNGQSYLERDRFICQKSTYKNIEVILVNDGSKDRSKKYVISLKRNILTLEFFLSK